MIAVDILARTRAACICTFMHLGETGFHVQVLVCGPPASAFSSQWRVLTDLTALLRRDPTAAAWLVLVNLTVCCCLIERCEYYVFRVAETSTLLRRTL